MSAVRHLLTGEEFGEDWPFVWYADAEIMRTLARGTGAMAALLPLPMAFGDDVIVTTGPESNRTTYTVSKLSDLLRHDMLKGATTDMADTYDLYKEGNLTSTRFPPSKVSGEISGYRVRFQPRSNSSSTAFTQSSTSPLQRFCATTAPTSRTGN